MDNALDDTVIRPRSVAPKPDVDDLLDADTILVGPGQREIDIADMDTVLVAAPSAPTPSQTPTPPAVAAAPTTAHYRFVVNAHEPIGLDRPALIGRRPAPPRVPQRQRPRLVRVPSPEQEVSSSHLELRQEGASVIVTDLRSTNGTVVVVPGSKGRRLRAGESLVVTPGTIIDIGDGNLIEVLPLSHAATTPGGTTL